MNLGITELETSPVNSMAGTYRVAELMRMDKVIKTDFR